MIILRGRTGHGKNRIREHGDQWDRVSLLEVGILGMSDKPKDTWPIRSLKTNEWRWFDFNNDPHFDIISELFISKEEEQKTNV
jgi:hypothetical protein|tara:strand:+ start:168 stop:416 length:249 start_codon:yes stop_codon:yes gene_type:complete